MLAGKVVPGGRRGDCPFERRRLPRIHRRLLALEHAPEDVNQENELAGAGNERREGHELVNRDHRDQVIDRRGRVSADGPSMPIKSIGMEMQETPAELIQKWTFA